MPLLSYHISRSGWAYTALKIKRVAKQINRKKSFPERIKLFAVGITTGYWLGDRGVGV
jgi:hypothetical protein